MINGTRMGSGTIEDAYRESLVSLIEECLGDTSFLDGSRLSWARYGSLSDVFKVFIDIEIIHPIKLRSSGIADAVARFLSDRITERLDVRTSVIMIGGPEPIPGSISPEAIEHPPHYRGAEDPYEAIKVIEAWGLGFCLGNAAKYICRAGRKPGVDRTEDLRKAKWYLEREISRGEPK